ncbi:DUF6207 family protein [Streptomyces hyaluromycini]|nr:DUF6207 family protein [Streptomyces hyaluromycini]
MTDIEDPASAASLTDVEPIQDVYLSEPGLLVIEVAGLDDASVFAFRT